MHIIVKSIISIVIKYETCTLNYYISLTCPILGHVLNIILNYIICYDESPYFETLNLIV
jgi:hypothetical protein